MPCACRPHESEPEGCLPTAASREGTGGVDSCAFLECVQHPLPRMYARDTLCAVLAILGVLVHAMGSVRMSSADMVQKQKEQLQHCRITILLGKHRSRTNGDGPLCRGLGVPLLRRSDNCELRLPCVQSVDRHLMYGQPSGAVPLPGAWRTNDIRLTATWVIPRESDRRRVPVMMQWSELQQRPLFRCEAPVEPPARGRAEIVPLVHRHIDV